MKEMENKYEINTDKLLDIACGNVIDREFSETLTIKLPKQLLKQWKKQKKRFESVLGAKVSDSQLLEWLIVEMENAPDESYQ
jgi:predicted alternative tryptophan synthase beta-subunit